MDQNQNDEQYGQPREPIDPSESGAGSDRPVRRYSLGVLLSTLCIAVLASVMLTYTLTASYVKGVYVEALLRKQEQVELLQSALLKVEGEERDKLQFLAALFEASSYYADKVSEEERLNAVLKAYAASTGDAYAEYYTEEEYAVFMEENVGQYNGLGVSVVREPVHVDGYDYAAFRVISVFKDSPAASGGIKDGDYIYAVKVDGAYVGIAALGGYSSALQVIRGEDGTVAELLAFRATENGYEALELSVVRGSYVAESVSYSTLEGDPSVGIVQISSFDMTTPEQFKSAIEALRVSGATRFVFDVRNNPGGDLMSIKAVLTYFLKEGDLILSAVDKDGNRARSYYAQAMLLSEEYAPCSVSREEIGMYADLDAAVLCNGNTASAAEVFVATMQDYGIAPVVGEVTFGKGIMQSIIPLSEVSGGVYDGYVKMTTYAYLTKRGVTYHEIGISPDEVVSLSEEAMGYGFYFLPQAVDDQLQAAVAALNR